jgi:hypothetical protein
VALERVPGIGSRVLGSTLDPNAEGFPEQVEIAGEVVAVYGDAFAVETDLGRLFVPVEEWQAWEVVSRPVRTVDPGGYL